MANFAFNQHHIDHQMPHAFYNPHQPPATALPPHYFYYPYQPPPPPVFQNAAVGAPYFPTPQHQQQRRVRRKSAPTSRRQSRVVHQPQAAPAAPAPVPPPVNVPGNIATSTEGSSPEDHCAFVFGWDFYPPDEGDDLMHNRPLYTPSPRSTNSDSRLKQHQQYQHELPSNPQVHALKYDAFGYPVLPNYAVPASAGTFKSPLEYQAYGTGMQVIDEVHGMPNRMELEYGQPQLSDLHRRLFPPGCQFSADGMGPH